MNVFVKLMIITFLIPTYLLSQDTLKIDPSVYYTSEEIEILKPKTKHIPKIEYACEIVRFSENHKVVEYCYYEENERTCIGREYKIKQDTLQIGEEKWRFVQSSKENYKIEKKEGEIITIGEASSLIPLKPNGSLYSLCSESLDTLWETTYRFDSCNPWGIISESFYQSKIEGELFEYNEIDTSPKFQNGSEIDSIEIDGLIPCYCEPMRFLTAISVTITKDGELKNIEQAIGNLDEWCPYTMMEIIKDVKSWKSVLPAKINGESVNVRWIIPVANNSKVMYSFPDNEYFRGIYIERKQKEIKKGIRKWFRKKRVK